MENKNKKVQEHQMVQELELEQLEKASGGQKMVFTPPPEPLSPYQPYDIEEAPDDIGLPKH